MLVTWATVATAIIGAGLAYNQTGLPRVALTSDIEPIIERVKTLEEFNLDTRALVLNQGWERTKLNLDELEARLSREPANRDLAQRVYMQRIQLQQIENQLESLSRR